MNGTEAEDNEYNWRKYNINVLTEGDRLNCPATGSVHLRGIPVRVYADEASPVVSEPAAGAEAH